jgi:glucose-6-phosphate dehydrogenase assembly protein OpcA
VAPDLTGVTEPILRSVPEIEQALGRLWAARHAGADEGRPVAARSRVLNLVVIAGHRETAERCAATIAATAGHHASRSLILTTVDADGPAGLEAWIEALSIAPAPGRAQAGTETIHVTAHGETGRHLASIIMPLLVHDLPVALWWPHDPQFGSHRADRLLPIADRLIVDGSSWSGDGLDRLVEMARVAARQGLAVADFALMRQARWREALASVYDLPDLRPHLRAVRSIGVEYAVARVDEPAGLTNIVRPLYHVAWLATRLGMRVDAPLHFVDGKGRRTTGGRETAGERPRACTLRQGDHPVEVELRPVAAELGAGSTVRVEIASELRGVELVGEVSGGEASVDVTVRDGGRERVRRRYHAPRLSDVELLGRAVEENASDPLAVETLAMARRLIVPGAPAAN